ncbi:MAG: SusD/RagB family nutrient-binding outer membrane lipoprotein [Bacteroidales bacterium]|nr:SusD/RagB family nutrient-binding outer membrane lipoprotein [Bacteroidales bacterium]
MNRTNNRTSSDGFPQSAQNVGRSVKGMALCLLCMILCPSCVGLFEEYNTNPNQVLKDQMGANNYDTGAKVLNLQNQVVPVQEHRYQFVESLSGGPFGGYVGSTKTWMGSFEYFNPESHWRTAVFADVMTDTYAPYRGIVNSTEDVLSRSFAKLFRVAIMHRLTDTYGPIPYSDAVANESLYVKYDSQEKTYDALFADLEDAIAGMEECHNTDASLWIKYDHVYNGNVKQWLMYANSLKLRIAMRLSYVKPELARKKASEAIAAGVILNNEDNAEMHATENRTTLIYNDWIDSRAGADIICYMNGYEDPRMEKMFYRNTLSTRPQEQIYAGVRIGCPVDSQDSFKKAYSGIAVDTGTPYLWFNAAEAAFLMAEYELRWGDPAAARTFYEHGITLSFEEKGVKGAAAYIADRSKMPAAYTDPLKTYTETARASEIKIAWEESGCLADGILMSDCPEERNLERIITQKWIAIFPLGNEAWAEYRRTGYPRLLPMLLDKSGGTVDLKHRARRLTYPIDEYNMNPANLQEAISILDDENNDRTFKGDKMGTRLWWDCKQYF